ncbi:hypothetical protein VUR80DRAFT_3346 [Thermomyces stellatus]
MPFKTKVQLVLLFSLNLAMVATTIYRVPHTVWKRGSQQYRSLMASVEILFAATAANALVLGSFVRDRGIKKPKFRYGFEDLESADRKGSEPRSLPTLQRHWGSDEDLVRGLGIGVKPELRQPESSGATPAPKRRGTAAGTVDMADWEFPRDGDRAGRNERSDDALPAPASSMPQRQLDFFDVGGLLDEDTGPPSARRDNNPNPPQPVVAHTRRGAATLLQDLGGFLSFSGSGTRERSQSVSAAEKANGESPKEGKRPATPELQDVEGLSRQE